MLPKTTSVTIRGDLGQRVTASGRLGASSVPVTPPLPRLRDQQHRWIMQGDDRGVYGQYPPAAL
jgi:hypothetical protein